MGEKQIQVGDKIKDNDPRMPNRVLKIIDVLPNGVRAESPYGKVSKHLMKFIHTDGKKRRSGFTLLKATP